MDETQETKEQTKVVLRKLTAPFPADEIKYRPQGGHQLAYVDARQVQNRLDSVLWPMNWEDRYELTPHGVVCSLTIRLPGGQLVTKQDFGAFSATNDEGDNFKGGFSDSFKRAAAKFGIGRHLYGVGVPTWHQQEAGAPTPRPAGTTPHRMTQPQQSARPQQDRPLEFTIPTNPRGYYPWIMRLGEHFKADLLNYVNSCCAELHIPRRTDQWTHEQADVVLNDMIGHIRELPGYKNEFGPQPASQQAPQSYASADDDIPFEDAY